MPDGEPTNPVTSTPAAAPAPTPAPAPAAAAPEPAAAPAAAAPAIPETTEEGYPIAGKNIVLPQSAMKRVKEEAREKGRKEAISSIASELGYGSIDEMREALSNARSGKAQPEEKPQQPAPAEEPPEKLTSREKFEKEREKWTRERDALAKQAAAEARRRRELQEALDAKEAEIALREAAVSAGIRDVPYAVHLLTQAIDGKSEAELKTFDERKFFEELRTSKPYLFGEVVKPATTGPGAGAPPTPKPGATAKESARDGQVDVKKMSNEEFRAYLRKMGLNYGL